MRIAIALAVLAGLSASARADEAGDLKACKAGKVTKCEELAEKYLTGDGVDKNEAKHLELLTKACDLKSSRACNNVGTSWSDGKNGATDKDHVKARKFYDKACSMKNGLGCFNLGNVFRLGEGVPVDVKAAAGHFKKSCDLAEAKGCTELGIMYYEGKGVPRDPDKALELLKKACDLKSEAACKNVTILENANKKKAP